MFRHIGMGLMAFLLGYSGAALAQTASPDVLVRSTTEEVVRIVKQDKDLKNGNPQKVYELVETKILPNFDFKTMTQYAVGKNWRSANADQQAVMVKEFRTLLVRTYSAAITSVVDYKIDYKPLRMQAGDADVMVNTEVSRSGSPPVTIDYRLEKQAGGWKVYDVLVDSVSLVTVYRNTFNNEVRRGGIDGLIQSLVRRNQRAEETGSK